MNRQVRKYEFKSSYRNDNSLRKSFNELTENTYGFSFEKWYEEGYWGDRYNPYSYVYNGKVVANVSVNVIDFEVLGIRKTFVQLGTVMTDKKFRGEGLSRRLIEIIIDEWKDKCDCMYLFANDSVLDFYPKFGFEEATEYEYSLKLESKEEIPKVRKLDMDSKEDEKLFYDLVSSSRGVSKLSMKDNDGLIMFYCLNFMKDSIYYIEELNVAAVCEFENNTLVVLDIFKNDNNLDIKDIINILGNDKAVKAKLGFTPIDEDGYEKKILKEEDTTLFVLKGKDNVFKDNSLMFPVLSHA